MGIIIAGSLLKTDRTPDRAPKSISLRESFISPATQPYKVRVPKNVRVTSIIIRRLIMTCGGRILKTKAANTPIVSS